MDERSKVIGRNVAKLRKAAKIGQAALAKEIGVAQNTIAAIETGKTRRSKHISDIARFFKVREADIDPFIEQEETVIVPGSQLFGESDIPVYASVEAGDGTLVYSSPDPIRMIRRPAPLIGIRGGFGVLVAGDSMIKRAFPGDTVLINPHLPPRPDDLCLFYSDEDGEFRATLKEYRSQTADVWHVMRYKPKEKLYSLSKKDWPKCLVVVGVYNGR